MEKETYRISENELGAEYLITKLRSRRNPAKGTCSYPVSWLLGSHSDSLLQRVGERGPDTVRGREGHPLSSDCRPTQLSRRSYFLPPW